MERNKFYILIISLLSIAIVFSSIYIIFDLIQKEKISGNTIKISEITVPKEGFKFKTESGKVIAELVLDKEGDTGKFRIFNNQGKIVAELGAYEYGGILLLFNNQGKIEAELSAKEGGTLSVNDKQGNNIAGLYSGIEGGYLWIYSAYGERVAELGAYESGYENGGILLIRNNQGSIVAGLRTYEEGGKITIHNATIPSYTNNEAEIIAELKTNEENGKFRILNNEGKAIVELPH